MKIKSSKQNQLKKKQVQFSKVFVNRRLKLAYVALATVGAIVTTDFLVPSADRINLSANAKQIHMHQVSSEILNKRQLIVALQSIRMHNVTRYQRTDSKNLEQSSINIPKIVGTSDNSALSPRVSHVNNANLNTAATLAAPVLPVQQGW